MTSDSLTATPVEFESHADRPGRRTHRPLIMVVDDDHDVRDTLCDILAAANYRVVQASNGNEAIDRMAAKTADIVVTDIMMPEKEGLETIRDVQRLFPGTKIVAISGGGAGSNMDYLDMAKRFGADRILTKPVRSRDLIATLEELRIALTMPADTLSH